MSMRQRCLTVGCNPQLMSLDAAAAHRTETGHRTAKWPMRSPEGQRRARQRNKSGYYDKYNAGKKSGHTRGGYQGAYHEDDHPFSSEALGQD